MSANTGLNRELVFLVMQYLREEHYFKTLHMLEEETKEMFDMGYFERLILEGDFTEANSYLESFTKLEENHYSIKMFFELRKQKYLEALDKGDKAEALKILAQQLKIFQTMNPEVYNELTQLLTLANIRDHAKLTNYTDARIARQMMMVEMRKLIEANPVLKDKLIFPTLQMGRLRTLINQSLNWQHSRCPNPGNVPEIRTLYVDHSCHGHHSTWTSTTAAATLQMASVATKRKEPDIQQPTYDPKRFREKVAYGKEGLPTKFLSRFGEECSEITAIAFRPGYPAICLSASMSGKLCLWDLIAQKLVASYYTAGSAIKTAAWASDGSLLCAVGLQNGEVHVITFVGNETSIHNNDDNNNRNNNSNSRNNVNNNNNNNNSSSSSNNEETPAFCGDLRLRITGHLAAVTDVIITNIAEEHLPLSKNVLASASDDGTIRVVDLETGNFLKQITDHESPVYSVVSQRRPLSHIFLSSSQNGKIMGWTCDKEDAFFLKADFGGKYCCSLRFSENGKRLFGCGDGGSNVDDNKTQGVLVELDQETGKVKGSYHGFESCHDRNVHLQSLVNRYLLVGGHSKIKFWDMDSKDNITLTHQEFQEDVCVGCNDEGTLIVCSGSKGLLLFGNEEGAAFLAKYQPKQQQPVAAGAASASTSSSSSS